MPRTPSQGKPCAPANSSQGGLSSDQTTPPAKRSNFIVACGSTVSLFSFAASCSNSSISPLLRDVWQNIPVDAKLRSVGSAAQKAHLTSEPSNVFGRPHRVHGCHLVIDHFSREQGSALRSRRHRPVQRVNDDANVINTHHNESGRFPFDGDADPLISMPHIEDRLRRLHGH